MMRKNHASWLLGILGIAACVLLLFTVGSMAKTKCATIPGGTILTAEGEVITTGYDEFGYNYQAHMFNGRYCFLAMTFLLPSVEILALHLDRFQGGRSGSLAVFLMAGYCAWSCGNA